MTGELSADVAIASPNVARVGRNVKVPVSEHLHKVGHVARSPLQRKHLAGRLNGANLNSADLDRTRRHLERFLAGAWELAALGRTATWR